MAPTADNHLEKGKKKKGDEKGDGSLLSTKLVKTWYDKNMPRTPRLLLSQSYYHVMTRGNNKNTVFRFDVDYLFYLDLIRRYKKDLPFELYHYCLMPNHVHLLIKTNNESDFSLFMKKLNLSYFHYYRKQYGWTGHFWQDRFKSQPVGKDNYFIQCGKYIELNPVRANLVSDPKDYLYSSYRYYIEGINDDLINEDFLYVDLGKTEELRRKKYEEIVISGIVIDYYKKPVWGSDSQRYNETKKVRYHGMYID